jgi:hypothetical protein
VKVFVLHDADGDIKSVIRLEQETEEMAVLPGSIVAPGEGETVTELAAEGIAADLPPLEIHENYRLDIASGTLVRTESTEDTD